MPSTGRPPDSFSEQPLTSSRNTISLSLEILCLSFTVFIAEAIVENPATGERVALESKTGNGDFERAQESTYRALSEGKAELFGKQANEAGIAGPVPGGMPVIREQYGAYWRIINRVVFGVPRGPLP